MDNGLVEFLTLLNAEETIVYECMTKGIEVNSMAEFYSDILLKSCLDNPYGSWVKTHAKFLELKGQMDYVEVLSHMQSMLIKYLAGFGDSVQFAFILRKPEGKEFKVKLNVDVPGNTVHVVKFKGMDHMLNNFIDNETHVIFKHMRIDFVDRVFGVMNLRFASGVIIYEVDFDDVILSWFSLSDKVRDNYPLNMFSRITMERYYDWAYLESQIEAADKQHQRIHETGIRFGMVEARRDNDQDDFFADF
jgi:hypothetical protein